MKATTRPMDSRQVCLAYLLRRLDCSVILLSELIKISWIPFFAIGNLAKILIKGSMSLVRH